jgi:hypothetical protein
MGLLGNDVGAYLSDEDAAFSERGECYLPRLLARSYSSMVNA